MKRSASHDDCDFGEESEETNTRWTTVERSETSSPRISDHQVKKRRLERPTNPRGRNITLQNLPPELVEHILGFLPLRNVVILGETCRYLHQVCNSRRTWRRLYRRIRPDVREAEDWRRQVILHYTKGIFFHHFSSRHHLCGQTVPPVSPNGYQRFLVMADNLCVLDHRGALFSLCGRICSYSFIHGEWRPRPQDVPLCQDVKDFTCDPRSGAMHRRYIYVLTSREVLTAEEDSICCDCVDIYVQSSGYRILRMTFDTSMKFKQISLLGPEMERQLLLLTETGKVYSLNVNEQSLNRTQSYITQISLRKMSREPAAQPVSQVYSHQGSVLYITDHGTAFMEVHTPAIFRDLFGTVHDFDSRETQKPQPITLPTKVVLCSLGYNHLALVDEFGRIFMQGSNRFGQLGTGDKIDRGHPCLIPFLRNPVDIFCGLHHTLVLMPPIDSVREVYGCGCGAGGRLPGWPEGSPTFVKLVVKVPMTARRISSTLDCLYIMSSYDTEETILYSECPASGEDEVAVVQASQYLHQLRRCTNFQERVAKTRDFVRYLPLPGCQKDSLWEGLGIIQRAAEAEQDGAMPTTEHDRSAPTTEQDRSAPTTAARR
ncbi:F-box only protein 24 [Anomaloglossus baeobatrachus]|uniref:F-box only protein 24 n=1 Tax=Anomaloglossus baeobatrachus TaxID=238106 RepID=UPI003F508DB1